MIWSFCSSDHGPIGSFPILTFWFPEWRSPTTPEKVKRSRIKPPSKVNSEEPRWRIFIQHSVWVVYSAHMFLCVFVKSISSWIWLVPFAFWTAVQRPGDYPQTTVQLQNWCVEFLWFSPTLCGRGALSFFPTSTTILRWEFQQGGR